MNERRDRSAWIDAGLAALAEAGPGAIKIPSIASRLGVTKGSFYWHFRDVATYEDGLLAAWEDKHTQAVIRRLDASGTSPEERLRRLLASTPKADVRLANAIRLWSATDVRANRAQKRVDRQRLAYVAALLRRLGWSAKEAETLARWAYWAVIGMQVTESPAIGPAEVEIVLRTFRARPAARNS